MIVKELICIFLLSGSLQVLASDERLEINKPEFDEEVKHFESSQKEYRKTAELQFHKDYSKWEDKASKFDVIRGGNYLKENEIDSNEYVDKYNKYGKTFDANSFFTKNKPAYQKKKYSESAEHHKEHEKPESLADDINVNYIDNNKEVSRDSEIIPGSFADDINVNYILNNKEVSRDSEIVSENAVSKSKENYQENYQNGNEHKLKRFKKDFYQNLVQMDFSNLPAPNDTVLMARYIVHTVDWAVLGTLSGRPSTAGFPFVCVKATSDGISNASTGVPFFYMSSLDLCTQDLQKDNRVSLLVTLSQTEYCKDQNLDPQDPRCAKLTITGKIKKIKPGSDEEKFAKNALFSRHPAMRSWPADHNWYFTKLKIGEIILLDQFGGATYIKVKDYLNGKIMEPEHKKINKFKI